ncbi:MAG: SDR family oxidoreductase [Elusimicrobiales bacterium]|nr:SDR family oxidoreductase [Elusimicrobiales bacterium]
MRALIIGASGQVGGTLAALCVRRKIEVYGTSRKGQGFLYLDLAEPESVTAAFEKSRPDLVLLCSALTHVDNCERDPQLAAKINAEGPALVAAECARAGAQLVYFSTEYVFDGAAGPYGEADEPNPASVYGRTKLEGERACLAVKGALAARTTVVYSHNPASKNFIMQLIGNHKAGAKMRVPSDQYSNPTYAPDLAAAVLDLAAAGASGIYNVVGPDWLSRYEFALKACEAFGFAPDFLEPKPTSDLGQAAARPLRAGLKTEKLSKKLGRSLPPAAESLRKIAGILKQYE